MEIQEEISMISPRTMDEAYQCALRAEEKLLSKYNSNTGRVLVRGRGWASGRGKFSAKKGESSS